jgi:hypothetical protein
VEEQTATTNEMSRSVTEAARGATQIADNITGVSGAAGATTDGRPLQLLKNTPSSSPLAGSG